MKAELKTSRVSMINVSDITDGVRLGDKVCPGCSLKKVGICSGMSVLGTHATISSSDRKTLRTVKRDALCLNGS